VKAPERNLITVLDHLTRIARPCGIDTSHTFGRADSGARSEHKGIKKSGNGAQSPATSPGLKLTRNRHAGGFPSDGLAYPPSAVAHHAYAESKALVGASGHYSSALRN
jgi:hypothetical protein